MLELTAAITVMLLRSIGYDDASSALQRNVSNARKSIRMVANIGHPMNSHR